MVLYHATLILPGKPGHLVEAFGSTQQEAQAHIRAALTRYIQQVGSDLPNEAWVRSQLGRVTFNLRDTAQVYVDGKAMMTPEEQLADGVFSYFAGAEGAHFDRGILFEGEDTTGLVEVAVVVAPDDTSGIHVSLQHTSSGVLEWAHIPFQQSALQGFVGLPCTEEDRLQLLKRTYWTGEAFWTIDFDSKESFIEEFQGRFAAFRGTQGDLVVLFGTHSGQVGVFFLKGLHHEEVSVDLRYPADADAPEYRKVDIVPKRAA